MKNHSHIHKYESESRGTVGVIREKIVDRIHCKSSNTVIPNLFFTHGAL